LVIQRGRGYEGGQEGRRAQSSMSGLRWRTENRGIKQQQQQRSSTAAAVAAAVMGLAGGSETLTE
jgi:hypothetical protein